MKLATRNPLGPLVTLTCLWTGCGGIGVPGGISSEGFSWVNASDDAIAGIDRGSVEIVTFRQVTPKSPTFVIWIDRVGSSDSRSGSTDYEMTQQVPDGPEIKLQYDLGTEGTEEIKIGDSTYSPAKGRLFLISTAGGVISVKQLDRPLESFPKDTKTLQTFAATDDAIREFFDPDGTDAVETADESSAENAVQE